MKKITLLFITTIIVTLFTACTPDTTLDDLGLSGMTGKEILEGIGSGAVTVDGYSVSVYDDELVVITENEKIYIDMPKDEFYVSVAPYIATTHECLYHSATGCRGELKNESFFVEYKLTDGTVVFSEEMTSLQNGFIDLWLPRDTEGTLTITYDNLTTSKLISTSQGSPTCETTMKLQ